MIRKLLHFVAYNLLETPREIWDREGGSLYLSRWYLVGDRPDENPEPGMKGQISPDYKPRARPFNLFLHRFHRSDDDGALHSHPWSWALSLVLVGGYSEERREGDRVVRRKVLPWRLNFLRGEDYHRVDLLEIDAWSLFLVGPKSDTWYFWDRDTKAKMRWVGFVRRKRGLPYSDKWIDDRREANHE